MNENLTRAERLRSGKEFARVFNYTEYTASTQSAKLLAIRNNLNHNRFAVTTVRKYGNAIVRNRARRLLKEIYRKSKYTIQPGLDILIILYSGHDHYHERERLFKTLVRRAGIEKSYH